MDKAIQLVALDIDGTLLDQAGSISHKTKLKLKELVEKGIHVVLATGRSNEAAVGIRKELSLDLPIISYNGSTVDMPHKGKIVDRKINAKDVSKIIQYGEKLGLYIIVYIDDIMYIEKDSESSRKFANYHNIECRVVGNLSEYVKSDVNMIVLVYDKLPKDDIESIFKDSCITTARSTPYVIEFMAKGSSKGRTLKWLSEYLNIKRENILAVGNALNDLEMLQYAKIGVAMKNSDHDLLDKWDLVSEYSNDEEGVYNIIKYLEKMSIVT